MEFSKAPNVLIDSSRAAPQHLTIDILNKFCKEASEGQRLGIRVYLNQIFTYPLYSKQVAEHAQKVSLDPSHLALSFITKLDKFILVLGFHHKSLLSSSINKISQDVPFSKENACVFSILAEGGVQKISAADIGELMTRLLPNVMISPVDPTLDYFYNRNPDEKSDTGSTKTCSKRAQETLNFGFNKKRKLETSNDEDIATSSVVDNASTNVDTNLQGLLFSSSSSKTKFIKRWKTCLERTLLVLDHLIFVKSSTIALSQSAPCIYASLSTQFLKYIDLFPTENLASLLKEEFQAREKNIQGFYLQVDDENCSLEENLSFLTKINTEILPSSLPKYLCTSFLKLKSLDELKPYLKLGFQIYDCSQVSTWSNEGKALVCDPESDTSNLLSLLESVYKNDPGPLCKSCKCYACSNYARCYIHHLLVANEMLAKTLLA